MKSKIIISVINQGLLSVFNFLLSIYLIKVLGFKDFGFYSLIFAIGLSLISFQNAFVTTPMSLLTKKRVLVGLSKYQSYFNTCQYVYLLGVVFICVIANYFIMVDLLAICIYLTAFCFRDYVKSQMLLSYKVNLVLISDILFVVSVVLLTLLIESYNLLSLSNILIILGGCSFFVNIICKNALNLRIVQNYRLFWKFYSFKIWRISKWTSIGVMLTELHSRAYLLVLSVFYSADILGLVQAARVLFGPLNLLINGWLRIARNYFASLLGENKRQKFIQFFNWSITGVVAVNFIVFLLVITLWDNIKNYLFESVNVDMLLTVLLWAGAVFIIQLRTVVSTALQAFGVFKMQAYFNAAASILTISIAIIISMFFSWKVMPLSIIGGEAILLSMSLLYYFKIKGRKFGY